VIRNAQALDESFTTMAEVLALQGFRTGAVVSLGVMASRFGLGQGFESYDDSFDRQWFRPAEEITDSALAMMEGWPGSDRFFAFVHYSDPHEPYTPPGLEYPMLDVSVDGLKVDTVRADGLGIRIPLSLSPGRHLVEFESVDADGPQTLTFQQLKLTGRKANLLLEQGWRNEAGTPPQQANRTVSLPATLSAVIGGTNAGNVECNLQFFVTEKLTNAVVRERYRLEVEYVDRQIGRLLDRLAVAGRLADTAVVITSDHGEGLGDHRLLGHIHQLYDTLIRVPLIIVAPGISRDVVRADAMVRHVDLRPTVLGLLGIEDPEPGVGVDFGTLLRGGQPPRAVTHLCMTYRPLARADLRGLIVGSHKLIRDAGSGSIELYDLATDPEELNDLAATTPESTREAAELSSTLDELLLQAGATSNLSTSPEVLTESEREMLEALGYASDVESSQENSRPEQ
jgi:arylsulfatase A-like enzyme